jgi:hypothetical protein
MQNGNSKQDPVDRRPKDISDGTSYHSFLTLTPNNSAASVEAPPSAKYPESLNEIAILEPTDADGTSNGIQNYPQERHYPQHPPSNFNSTAPIDATASRKSFESLATLRSLLDRGEV